MAFCVRNGAILKCSFGMIPSKLNLIPPQNVGKCCDCIPFVNIPPFSMCRSLLNPITAAQTVAAAGILTPGICTPVPVGMWIPTKPTVRFMNSSILTDNSILTCAYGGVINIVTPLEFKVTIV